MKERQIPVNNNAGAFTDIFASIPCRRAELMEDEGGTTQGLQAKSLLDNFATTETFSFGSEPLILGNTVANQDNAGPVLGMPEQNAANGSTAFNHRAADKLFSVRSNGASGTTVRVLEFD